MSLLGASGNLLSSAPKSLKPPVVGDSGVGGAACRTQPLPRRPGRWGGQCGRLGRGLPFPAPFCCGRSSGRARRWDEPSHGPRPGRQPGGPEEPATTRLTAHRAASRGRSQEPQPGKSPSERGSAGCACGRTGGDWGRSGLVGSSPIFNQKSKRALGGPGRGRAGRTCVSGRARRVTLEGGSIAPPGGIEARMAPGAQPVGRMPCVRPGRGGTMESSEP